MSHNNKKINQVLDNYVSSKKQKDRNLMKIKGLASLFFVLIGVFVTCSSYLIGYQK